MGGKAGVTKIAGLYTSPNALSSVPEGALRKADNCVINFPNVLESRRGFEWLAYTYGTSLARASALFAYEGHLLVQHGTSLAYDTGAALTNYSGTHEPPDAALLRMKGAEIAQNFYFTSAAGVKKLDAFDGTPVAAGVPRAMLAGDFRSIRLADDPGDGWFEPNGQVAYIALLGRRDEKDNVVLGEASTPAYVVNPADYAVAIGEASKAAGTSNVTITGADWVNGSHGYIVGSRIDVDFDAADAAVFADGVFTVTAVGSNYITYSDASVSVGGGTNTVAAALTSGSKNTSVEFNLTSEVDGSYFMQVYRTKQSLDEDDVPAPDYFLVQEVELSGVSGSYTFTDTVADSLLLSPFYGNANIGYEIPDGASDNENGRPPLTRDLEVWDDRLWGANFEERQNLIINLLGVGAPDGLQAGDTITIAGTTYTAVTESATPTTIPAQFRVYDTAWYLPSEAVARTAQSLAVAVSQTNATVNCYYTSSDDEVPGELFLEAKAASASTFTVYVSRASAWNPVIGTDSGSALSSDSDTATNGLWFSKKEGPEEVPRLNRLSVGPRNGNILRIKALGERLFVFTDRAIYTVSGQFPYRVDLLSKTAVLVAPDSLVDFDDALFGLTTQGVVRISDAGIGIVSLPIESDIKRLFGEALPTLRVNAQAVGYESYNKYILSMPTEASDTNNTQSLVYDVKTQTWTRWNKAIHAAVVIPETDYLHIAYTDSNKIGKERKTYSKWDYVDESWAVTVNAETGRTVTLADASNISRGDLLYQTSLCHAIVESVDGSVVAVKTTEDWTVGLATRLYKAVSCEFMFQDQFVGSPDDSKHFPVVTYHWKTPAISEGVALFQSEHNPAEQEVTTDMGGWGDARWGAFAWATPSGSKNKRVIVPKNATQCAFLGIGFRVAEGLGVWALLGYTVRYEDVSDRNSR